jgi:hypothetical protein
MVRKKECGLLVHLSENHEHLIVIGPHFNGLLWNPETGTWYKRAVPKFRYELSIPLTPLSAQRRELGITEHRLRIILPNGEVRPVTLPHTVIKTESLRQAVLTLIGAQLGVEASEYGVCAYDWFVRLDYTEFEFNKFELPTRSHLTPELGFTLILKTKSKEEEITTTNVSLSPIPLEPGPVSTQPNESPKALRQSGRSQPKQASSSQRGTRKLAKA